jgi:hypothetical protein
LIGQPYLPEWTWIVDPTIIDVGRPGGRTVMPNGLDEDKENHRYHKRKKGVGVNIIFPSRPPRTKSSRCKSTSGLVRELPSTGRGDTDPIDPCNPAR